MKYKVGIDLTYIMNSEATGIKKYGEEIVEGLQKANQDYEVVIFVNDALEEEYKKKFPNFRVISIKFWFNNVRYVRRINVLGISKKHKMKKEKCDLIIYPYVCNYTKILKEQKKIVIIHDIIPLDEIQDKESKEYKNIKSRYIDLMNSTKNIVTISKYSKKRLEDIYPNYEGKIDVIPNSVQKLENSNINAFEFLNMDKPYIFSINSFLKHKNQITLVKAFNEIKDKVSHNLVLVRKTRTRR